MAERRQEPTDPMAAAIGRALSVVSDGVTHLADAAGVSYAALNAYRQGKRRPDLATVDRIAEAMEEYARRVREEAAQLRREASRHARDA